MEIFKSVKWKLAVMCALCITAILTLVCTMNIGFMIYGEKQNFEDAVTAVFDEGFVKELSEIAESVDYTVNSDGSDLTVSSVDTDNTGKLYDRIMMRSGELGINMSRYMCILDGLGNPLKCTNEKITDEGIAKTASVIAALNGNVGVSSSLIQKQMDYALPLNTTKNIIYIKDTGEVLYKNVHRALVLYLECFVVAFILSIISGLYVAGSVTIPLKRLSLWAKKLAEGNLDAKTEVAGYDELSELADSLFHMAHNLDATSSEAENEKMKIETILQSMTDGLLAFNTKGALIHYNSEAKRLLGRNFLDDMEFDKYFKEINADITIGDLLYMMPEGGIERNVKIDNRFIVMNFQTFMLEGKVAGIVVVLHDTTKQEMLEESRRVFVADVSHELRTPITTIKSYAETLIDSCDGEDDFQSRFLKVIASEADRMARLISDLLTLSALDDKHMSYKIPEKIDIRDMVDRVTDRLRINAEKKDQQLIYSPINDVPIIMGDSDALERVIINIIGNAVKYTQTGGTINVYTSRLYNDICIKVSDNGIGIPEENLPHIFDRFYRVDKARSRDTGGTGLGLAIAKQTVENGFNGKIKIVSEVGKGTEVSVTIPVPEPA